MTDTRRAAKAFEDFTGRKPVKQRVAKLDSRDVAGWEMGPMLGVAYQAKRDGVTRQYFHEFAKKARPNLIARDDGSKLYIEGGRYKVTDRGIEDMPELFVVNPSPRKRKRKPMARRRTSTRRRRRTSQVAIFRANPVRRRRRRRASVRRYASNPVRRRRRSVRVRRYRRNPSSRGMMGGFGKFLPGAAGIGLGAVGTEIAMSYLPIPANLKVGVMRQVTKGVVGIGLGMLLGKVLRQKRLGNFFALGAVAIAVHDGVKEWLTKAAPSIGFGMYLPRGGLPSSLGYYSPAQVVGSGMGRYLPQGAFAGAVTQRGDGTVDPDYYV